jgi:hypothetical protein
MQKFYIRVDSITDIQIMRGRALAHYKSDSLTTFSIQKDQTFKIVQSQDNWSWAIDEKGRTGWVPTTVLRMHSSEAVTNELHEFVGNLWVTVGSVNESIPLNLNRDEQRLKMIIDKILIFDCSAINSNLDFILETSRVLGRTSLPIREIYDHSNQFSEIYEGSIVLPIKNSFISSCVINFTVTRDGGCLETRQIFCPPSILQSVDNQKMELLPGEIDQGLQPVRAYSNGICNDGKLVLTNHRLLYLSPPSTACLSEFFTVPLLCIDSFEVCNNILKVVCKDLRVLEFNFLEAFVARIFSEQIQNTTAQNFCYQYYNDLKGCSSTPGGIWQSEGWEVYKPERVQST